MRFLTTVSSLVLVTGCGSVQETPVPAPARKAAHAETRGIASPRPLVPQSPLESTRATRSVISGITFEGVAFDSRQERLVVADQAGGPGSEFPDAAGAGRACGGLAAVNAGFFTPAGEPLGLVVSEGKRSGSWNSASSLGAGVWHEDFSGRSAITRREALGRSMASGMRELLQAGPMLVDNGRGVSGLEATIHSVRTMLLWDGASRWWVGRASACTLADLGAALASGTPAGWPVRHALNLDGGRSSDLWISESVSGGPITKRAPWNRLVRNFLILQRR